MPWAGGGSVWFLLFLALVAFSWAGAAATGASPGGGGPPASNSNSSSSSISRPPRRQAKRPPANITTTQSPPTEKTWHCPTISRSGVVYCSCDLPHTLRCTGGRGALSAIGSALRALGADAEVSLLDCTVRGVSSLPGPLLEGVTLHGLVISSGELRKVSERAFAGLAGPLQALGLPSNQLDTVPIAALRLLPSLDRLDLSLNRLTVLNRTSFQGLWNLSFLELSDNAISEVASDTFVNVTSLRTLRLRDNRLSTGAALAPLYQLEELDFSGNALVGPLEPKSLPAFPRLRTLIFDRNQLSSVRLGALTGLPSLQSLSLRDNQIDVLEDHAFKELATLRQLTLAHNRIVAVSGASLAHLIRLTQLDLAHNFLRALTADLVQPLRNLKELRLDDNDISIVTSDALGPGVTLARLTLADNPLNCDCSLSEFASWLANATNLSRADRATAVCTTPPVLENGLLIEVPINQLLCGENEADTGLMGPPDSPGILENGPPAVSGAQVSLRSFRFDGTSLHLQWAIDATAGAYACDALFVYEEVGEHEVLLDSNPVACNSSTLEDPRALDLTLSADGLQPGARYRYCLVLLKSSAGDDMALVLGCSEVLPLEPVPPRWWSQEVVRELEANLTGPATLLVTAKVWDLFAVSQCLLLVDVYAGGTLTSQRSLNCTEGRVVISNLPPGPYRVCVSPGPSGVATASTPNRCVHLTAITRGDSGWLRISLTALLVALTSILVIAASLGARRLLKRPKLLPTTHQCFLAAPQTEQQHSRYVKLQATTKL